MSQHTCRCQAQHLPRSSWRAWNSAQVDMCAHLFSRSDSHVGCIASHCLHVMKKVASNRVWACCIPVHCSFVDSKQKMYENTCMLSCASVGLGCSRDDTPSHALFVMLALSASMCRGSICQENRGFQTGSWNEKLGSTAN